MAGQIPEEFINDLRHRVDIVEIIGEYVPLKKQGQNYTGLCPFHSEKTPSFIVSPHKQIFHCFGCGKGGNVFSFLMEKNAMTFPDTVAFLAERYGLILPKEAASPQNEKRESLKKRYYHINEIAANYYKDLLEDAAGRDANEYLKKRGVTQKSKEKFLLGYASKGWDNLTRFLINKGITEQEILILGLAVKSKNGKMIDRFRSRIIFPIWDEAGRIIGFGGRTMDDTQPKYLNSPDTPLFSKGRFLYGMHLAKGNIRGQDRVIIMEGYMDVITAHQYGISNTVGTLGTALTLEQTRLLMRYTYNTYICFDTDAAGQKAALRGLDILQQQGCQVSIITVSEGKDPDEFLKKKGTAAFLDLVGKAQSLLEYRLNMLTGEYDVQTVNGKIQVIQALIPDIQKVQSPVARQAFIQLVAEHLGFPETAIHAEIKKAFVRPDSQVHDGKKQVDSGSASWKAQKILIRMVVEKPESLKEIEKYGGKELFSEPLLKEIYENHYLIRQAGHNIKANDLINLLKSDEAQQIYSRLLLEEENLEDWERVLKDCLGLLRMELLNRKIAEKSTLMSRYEKAGEVSRSLELMTEIQQLVRDKQSLTITLRKGGNNNFED